MVRALAILAALLALVGEPEPAPDPSNSSPPPSRPPHTATAAAREIGATAAVVRALRRTPAGGTRAIAATRPLAGAPYLASPLGEGDGPDADPRFRLDAFDCWTFVETAVALGSAGSLEEARLALDDVRYGGPPSLAARNHEVLSQWIPRNLEKGWIGELTGATFGGAARRIETTYSPERWRSVRQAGRAIAGLPAARLPAGTFALDVIAPEAAVAAAGAVPEGAIVLVVRQDRPDRATRITHAGLIVSGPGGTRRVRHATSSVSLRRVIEEPFALFAAREVKAWPAWPVEGLAFLEIRDASDRVRSLRAPARPSGARSGVGAPAPAPGPPL